MPKGVDPLKWGSPQYEARQRRHRHNGFLGTVSMAFQGMAAIRYASTTTQRAKELSDCIAALLGELQAELKTRID
jgi:hypothetical protein